MRKIIVLILFAFVMIPFLNAQAAPLNVSAKQGIVMDLETGQVLWEQNADARMPTSSMSKVITGIAVYEAIRSGDITLDTTFRVSENAWSKGGSKMFVELGSEISVDDLLNGVVVQSGNDACIVLAEGLAGAEEAFASRLNRIAKDIGMNNSNFTNATGWPDDNHYSTARDLAIMARHLIKEYPEQYDRYRLQEFTYNGIRQGNRNPLLGRTRGGDGVKTGHTEAAGYGLIGSAIREGRRILFVMNGWPEHADRNREGPQIIEWAFGNFKNESLVSANTTLDQINVLYGQEEAVSIGLTKDLKVSVEVGGRAPDMRYEIKAPEAVKAPLKKGDTVGQLLVYQGETLKTTRDLIALNDIEEVGFFGRAIDNIELLLGL